MCLCVYCAFCFFFILPPFFLHVCFFKEEESMDLIGWRGRRMCERETVVRVY